MSLNPRWALMIAAACIFLTIGMGKTEGKSLPMPVEVWCNGDDGLTIRLRDALENAFKSSPDFHLSSEKEPRSLVVTIPTNVGWKQFGRRTKILYTVEFASSDNHSLGESKGSCWDDEFSRCATQVVKHAKIAARKIK